MFRERVGDDRGVFGLVLNTTTSCVAFELAIGSSTWMVPLGRPLLPQRVSSSAGGISRMNADAIRRGYVTELPRVLQRRSFKTGRWLGLLLQVCISEKLGSTRHIPEPTHVLYIEHCLCKSQRGEI